MHLSVKMCYKTYAYEAGKRLADSFHKDIMGIYNGAAELISLHFNSQN